MRDAAEIAEELKALLAKLAEIDSQVESATSEILSSIEVDPRKNPHQMMQLKIDQQQELLKKIKSVSKEYIENISGMF